MQVKQAAINQTLLPNMYMELQKPRALLGTSPGCEEQGHRLW